MTPENSSKNARIFNLYLTSDKLCRSVRQLGRHFHKLRRAPGMIRWHVRRPWYKKMKDWCDENWPREIWTQKERVQNTKIQDGRRISLKFKLPSICSAAVDEARTQGTVKSKRDLWFYQHTETLRATTREKDGLEKYLSKKGFFSFTSSGIWFVIPHFGTIWKKMRV